MEYIKDQPVGLCWTGHPLMDMGVAGLTVFAQKRRPEDVTGADLEGFAAWAEGAYQTKEGVAWVAVAFTLNGFLNPSPKVPEAKRREDTRAVLNSFKQTGTLEAKCAFFGLPACQMAARDLVPMLTGREPANFFTNGQVGLPLSGLAITVLQGLCVAAPLVSGRLLVVDADDPKLLMLLCEAWQPHIRQRVQLSQATGEKANGWSSPRSRLIDEIINIEIARSRTQDTGLDYQGSATIYHFSNSGQGPDINIYPLEVPALRFVRKAQALSHREAWQHLVISQNVLDKDKDPQYGTSNRMHEALFALPLEAPSFVRRFFKSPIRNRLRPTEETKKTKGKKVKEPSPAVEPVALWGLLTLFLQEVVGMEKSRIEQIRKLGDTLAQAVQEENDRQLFKSIYEAKQPSEVRALFKKFGYKRLKLGLEPVRTDQYLHIFEEGEELARADFYLAWDLTVMRTIETLFDKQWFSKELLATLDVESEEGEK